MESTSGQFVKYARFGKSRTLCRWEGPDDLDFDWCFASQLGRPKKWVWKQHQSHVQGENPFHNFYHGFGVYQPLGSSKRYGWWDTVLFELRFGGLVYAVKHGKPNNHGPRACRLNSGALQNEEDWEDLNRTDWFPWNEPPELIHMNIIGRCSYIMQAMSNLGNHPSRTFKSNMWSTCTC